MSDDIPTETEYSGPEGFHRRMHDEAFDIGHGVHIRYTVTPRSDDDRCGLILSHIHDDDSVCQGSISFDIPIMQELFPDRPRWQVESTDPLTLSPSISIKGGPDATECLHGYIRQGRWVPV